RGWFGALWALGVIAEIVLFLLMSRLLARFSLKQLLVVGFVLAALRWLLLGWLGSDLARLLSVQQLYAAPFGCVHVTAVHLVQRSFGSEHQGQAQALYATLSGCGGALGALYAGYSWNSLGAGWTFTLASLAAAAAALLLWRRLPARV